MDGDYILENCYNVATTYRDKKAKVANATFQTIFKWERSFAVSDSKAVAPFGYGIPVPTRGRYLIRAHFAEIEFQKPGQRVFGLAIDGKTEFDYMDLVAQKGFSKAFVYEKQMDITSGSVQITLIPRKSDPKFSAVEVILMEAAPTPAPVPPPTTAPVKPPVSAPVAPPVSVSVPVPVAQPVSAPAPTSTGSLPWLETFSQPDGTKIRTGTISWTASRTTGNFDVRNGALRIQDNGSEAVLTTGEISISETMVYVSVDVLSQGNLEAFQDYVQLYAKVDGGSEVMIGQKLGNQAPTATITGTIRGGSKLVLVIRAFVSHSSEEYFIDNLSVSSSLPAPVSAPVQAPVPAPMPVPLPAPVPVPVPTPVTVPIPAPVPGTVGVQPIRINIGGGATPYVDTNGKLWQSDTFVSGSTYGSNCTGVDPIAATADDALFCSSRWFGPTDTSVMSIPIVTPGQYTVRLLFAELVRYMM